MFSLPKAEKSWRGFLFDLRSLLITVCVVATPSTSWASTDYVPVMVNHYHHWRQQHIGEIRAYEVFLKAHKVDNIVPSEQLLKTARNWDSCNVELYAVPPKQIWANIIPTLKAVKRLKATGALKKPIAASVYRNPSLNKCAGGAENSRHLILSAIDFDIDASPSSLPALCHQWRRLGPGLKLGLGFYTPTRIHLDTTGFRTWGTDHSRNTSLCMPQK
jgi:hypothetical protein